MVYIGTVPDLAIGFPLLSLIVFDCLLTLEPTHDGTEDSSPDEAKTQSSMGLLITF